MASYSNFLLAFFITLSLSCLDISLAARIVLQFPSVPSNPRFGHPTLPISQPSLPNPEVPSAVPLPTASNVPGVPSIPTTTAFPMVSNVPGVPSIPMAPATPNLPKLYLFHLPQDQGQVGCNCTYICFLTPQFISSSKLITIAPSISNAKTCIAFDACYSNSSTVYIANLANNSTFSAQAKSASVS
ncbi:conserved hypothetical protein [Ricinus communis]|uniref:Lipid binding protein n=1 Tax=Ricinus communis TaxID=3988 RepID=B9S9G3_RICCO|nr:conserved hypothetical protein [Ricinus communis]